MLRPGIIRLNVFRPDLGSINGREILSLSMTTLGLGECWKSVTSIYHLDDVLARAMVQWLYLATFDGNFEAVPTLIEDRSTQEDIGHLVTTGPHQFASPSGYVEFPSFRKEYLVTHNV